MADISKEIEKGIRKEKTKESLSIFMVLGLIIISIILVISTHWTVGLVSLLAGLFGIWRFYSS